MDDHDNQESQAAGQHPGGGSFVIKWGLHGQTAFADTRVEAEQEAYALGGVVEQASDYLAALSPEELAALEETGRRQAARYQAAATSVLGVGDKPGAEIFTTAARHQRRFTEMASAELARRSTPAAARPTAPGNLGKPGATRPQAMTTAPGGSPRSSMRHRRGAGFSDHVPSPRRKPNTADVAHPCRSPPPGRGGSTSSTGKPHARDGHLPQLPSRAPLKGVPSCPPTTACGQAANRKPSAMPGTTSTPARIRSPKPTTARPKPVDR